MEKNVYGSEVLHNWDQFRDVNDQNKVQNSKQDPLTCFSTNQM